MSKHGRKEGRGIERECSDNTRSRIVIPPPRRREYSDYRKRSTARFPEGCNGQDSLTPPTIVISGDLFSCDGYATYAGHVYGGHAVTGESPGGRAKCEKRECVNHKRYRP